MPVINLLQKVATNTKLGGGLSCSGEEQASNHAQISCCGCYQPASLPFLSFFLSVFFFLPSFLLSFFLSFFRSSVRSFSLCPFLHSFFLFFPFLVFFLSLCPVLCLSVFLSCLLSFCSFYFSFFLSPPFSILLSVFDCLCLFICLSLRTLDPSNFSRVKSVRFGRGLNPFTNL